MNNGSIAFIMLGFFLSKRINVNLIFRSMKTDYVPNKLSYNLWVSFKDRFCLYQNTLSFVYNLINTNKIRTILNDQTIQSCE